MANPESTRRRARWSDIAVLGLVAVALLLGLVVRQQVAYAAAFFEQGGISGACPAGWLRVTGDDPLLRVEDTLGGTFNTLFELRTTVLAAEVELALALDALALERAGQVSLYDAIGTDTVEVGGQTAARREFVYVYHDPNPYLQRLPVVVKGVDLALRAEGRVIIATLLAAADDFDSQQARFLRFVESLEYAGEAGE